METLDHAISRAWFHFSTYRLMTGERKKYLYCYFCFGDSGNWTRAACAASECIIDYTCASQQTNNSRNYRLEPDWPNSSLSYLQVSWSWRLLTTVDDYVSKSLFVDKWSLMPSMNERWLTSCPVMLMDESMTSGTPPSSNDASVLSRSSRKSSPVPAWNRKDRDLLTQLQSIVVRPLWSLSPIQYGEVGLINFPINYLCKFLFCSTSWSQASARWVPLTLSSLCPLF